MHTQAIQTMQTSDSSFLMAIGLFMSIGAAYVIMGFVMYVGFQTLHDWLHDSSKIARSALLCRKLGQGDYLALAEARQKAEKLGYMSDPINFIGWYENRFGRSIWQQQSFIQIFRSKLSEYH